MIKPTIGRRVWYWPSMQETSDGTLAHHDGLQPLDAGIAFVHDGGREVNLTVADHRGVMHARLRVPLLQDGDAEPEMGSSYAQWMPYQVGQAAKASSAAAEEDQRKKLDRIASLCHEVNRAYCQTLGDNSQPAWEDAPAWQRESARMGVDLHMSGDFGPEASHISWMKQKLEDGWTYGPVKAPDLKQHPCMVPFAELPREQQAKDFIFRAVVHALR